MNYYEHHLGDYAAATAHLSWDEDMAYTRLIRAYYHHERPLPVEVKDVCRLVRATSSVQKKAVETVLREFFTLDESGWHQKRCDEEIARYQDKRSKAQRSADARWSAKRSDSDGNANASGSGDANALRTQCDGNAPSLQSPVSSPNHQTPDTKNQRAHALAEARAVQGVNVSALDRWVGYRDQRKPAIKTVSLVAAAEKLAALGDFEQQALAVQHSIADGYQGLFPAKINGNHTPATKAPKGAWDRLMEANRDE